MAKPGGGVAPGGELHADGNLSVDIVAGNGSAQSAASEPASPRALCPMSGFRPRY